MYREAASHDFRTGEVGEEGESLQGEMSLGLSGIKMHSDMVRWTLSVDSGHGEMETVF